MQPDKSLLPSLRTALRNSRKKFPKACMTLASQALANLPADPTSDIFQEDKYPRETKFLARVKIAEEAGWTKEGAIVVSFFADSLDIVARAQPSHKLCLAEMLGVLPTQQQIHTLHCILDFVEPEYLTWICNPESEHLGTSKVHPSLWRVSTKSQWVGILGKITDEIHRTLDQAIDFGIDFGEEEACNALLGVHNKIEALICQINRASDEGTYEDAEREHFIPPLRWTSWLIFSEFSKSSAGIKVILKSDLARRVHHDDFDRAIKKAMKGAYREDILEAVMEAAEGNWRFVWTLCTLLAAHYDSVSQEIKIRCWVIILAAKAWYSGYLNKLINDYRLCPEVRAMVVAALTKELQGEEPLHESVAISFEILFGTPATAEENHSELLELMAAKAPRSERLDTALATLVQRQSTRADADVSKTVSQLLGYVDSNIDQKHSLTIVKILGPLAIPGLEEKFQEAGRANKKQKQHRLAQLIQAAGAEAEQVADLLFQMEK